MGALDQHCSNPSVTWAVHIIWTPGKNYMGQHPGRGLMAQPVLGAFYLLPWVLLPRESWFCELFPVIAQHDCTGSHCTGSEMECTRLLS